MNIWGTVLRPQRASISACAPGTASTSISSTVTPLLPRRLRARAQYVHQSAAYMRTFGAPKAFAASLSGARQGQVIGTPGGEPYGALIGDYEWTAHPDDIEFYCAGVVLMMTARGVAVDFVLATSGDKGARDTTKSRAKMAQIREREQELLRMFNRAAADVTREDREERESLLGAFVGGQLD